MLDPEGPSEESNDMQLSTVHLGRQNGGMVTCWHCPPPVRVTSTYAGCLCVSHSISAGGKRLVLWAGLEGVTWHLAHESGLMQGGRDAGMKGDVPGLVRSRSHLSLRPQGILEEAGHHTGPPR